MIQIKVVVYSTEEKSEYRVVQIYQKRGNFIKVRSLGLTGFKCPGFQSLLSFVKHRLGKKIKLSSF